MKIFAVIFIGSLFAGLVDAFVFGIPKPPFGAILIRDLILMGTGVLAIVLRVK